MSKRIETAGIVRSKVMTSGNNAEFKRAAQVARKGVPVAVLIVAGFLFAVAGAEGQSEASGANTNEQEAPGARDGLRDFDFNIGTWKTHVSRLQHPLSDSTTWLEYEGVSVVSKVWNGRANLLELRVDGPAGRIEGLGLRLYNPRSRQWSLNWANSSDGVMMQPVVGEFKDGRGEFFSHESFNGRAILVRNVFSDITRNSSRFEQAFSDNGGKTWQTNWVITFTRSRDAASTTE